MFELTKKDGPSKAQDQAGGPEQRPEAGAGRSDLGTGHRRPAGQRDAAVIGPSIHIDGDLRGEEDLLIDGEVNGAVHLKSHSLTIGSQGKIKADVYADSIYVEGFMEGDLYGSERVAIRKTAQVRGNVTSPRVSLEEGAKFKGSIEMDPEAVEAALGPSRGVTKPSTMAVKPAPAAGDGAAPRTHDDPIGTKPSAAAASAKRG